jgi:hypothetical protein
MERERQRDYKAPKNKNLNSENYSMYGLLYDTCTRALTFQNFCLA